MKFQFVALLIFSLFSSSSAQAQPLKVFQANLSIKPGQAIGVSYQAFSESSTEKESYEIQFNLLWYSHVLYQLGDDPQAQILKEKVDAYLKLVATDKGLSRAKLKAMPLSVSSEKVLSSVLQRIPSQGIVIQFPLSPEDVKLFGLASVFSVFEKSVSHLSENALRMWVLSLGAMQKWYESKGKWTDQKSTIEAPAHGLTTAATIIENLSKLK